MKKKMRYLAIAAAIAVLMSAGGCSKQEVVETATDVAAVESASDVVTTTVGTEQTTIVSSTSAQEEITLVTATEPTTAEKAVETAKATQNTTKKTNAKAATTKATVKAAQKVTTKANTKKTTTTAKVQANDGSNGLSAADIRWAQQKANEYIASLPNVYLNTSLNKDNSSWHADSGFPTWATTKEKLLERFKEKIDCEKSLAFESGYDEIDFYFWVEKDEYGWYYNLLRLNHLDLN